MNDKKEFVATIWGALFFLSKSMGKTPNDFFFSAHLYELDKNSVASSYLEIKAKEKEELEKEFPLDDDNSYNEETYENMVTIRGGIGFLEKFIGKIFDKKIGNYVDVADWITGDIWILFDWNLPDECYMYDYHRSYELGEEKKMCHQSGKTLFLPIEGNEFLILHFHAKGKNSDILGYSVESIEELK